MNSLKNWWKEVKWRADHAPDLVFIPVAMVAICLFFLGLFIITALVFPIGE